MTHSGHSRPSIAALREVHAPGMLAVVDKRFAVRDLWNFAGSFRFDVGGPDHLAPFLSLVGDELAEIGRRHWNWSTTQVGEPRLYLRIGEARIDLLVELVDNFGRRVLRRGHAVPPARFVARDEIAHGRDVRQHI